MATTPQRVIGLSCDPLTVHCNNAPEDICTPPQPLPPSMANFSVPPGNIIVTHTCSADLSRCMGTGTETFVDWATWIENNLILPYCDLKSKSCQIMVSKASADGKTVSTVSKDLGLAIADCLGMSVDKPHVIYDTATKTAIAGKITLDNIPCATFNNLMITCIPDADTGAVPTAILGYEQTLYKEPRYYKLQIQNPLKFVGNPAFNDPTNQRLNVVVNDRLTISNTTESYHDREGSTWNSATTTMEVGADGEYMVDFAIMLNVKYSNLAGWIAAFMCGLKISHADGSADTEIRTDERVLYLSDAATDGQDLIISGNTMIKLKTGDTVQPRVWYNNTQLPAGVTTRTLNIWINKSADTHFSIYRLPDTEFKVGN